jgi:hypothetical protein
MAGVLPVRELNPRKRLIPREKLRPRSHRSREIRESAAICRFWPCGRPERRPAILNFDATAGSRISHFFAGPPASGQSPVKTHACGRCRGKGVGCCRESISRSSWSWPSRARQCRNCQRRNRSSLWRSLGRSCSRHRAGQLQGWRCRTHVLLRLAPFCFRRVRSTRLPHPWPVRRSIRRRQPWARARSWRCTRRFPGKTNSTRSAASRSPANAATTDLTCSNSVAIRNVGARP